MSNEADLITAMARGDAAAFELLQHRWGGPIFALAYRLCGDPDAAHDLRQNALLRIHAKASSYGGRAALSSWIYRIVLNLVRDRERGRSREAPLEDRQPLAKDGGPLEGCLESERERRVVEAVAALPAREREVLVLRHYHAIDFEFMAKLLDEPASTLKSRFGRAMQRLRLSLRDVAANEEKH